MENQEKSITITAQIGWKNVGIDDIPLCALGKILCKLSIAERIRSERVSRRWRVTMRDYGWKGQKGLSYEVVFNGAERVNPEAFTNGKLVALFKRIGKQMTVLDLASFISLTPVTRYVCGALWLLPNLTAIHLGGDDLLEAVKLSRLPETLREITIYRPFNDAALTAFAARCPNLETIEINDDENKIAVSSINDFLLNCPRLKKLYILCQFVEDSGTLTSIASLKELEEFILSFDHRSAVPFPPIDGECIEAIAENCKRLRLLCIYDPFPVSEESLCNLSKLENLVELVFARLQPSVTDSVVKAIAKCKHLKKLKIHMNDEITDESIVYLVEHCKSLDTLDVQACYKLTGKSLDAVIAEVNRRHGCPPRKLPEGPTDKGIFYFYFHDSPGIEKWVNHHGGPSLTTVGGFGMGYHYNVSLPVENPWLQINFSEELLFRHFKPSCKLY